MPVDPPPSLWDMASLARTTLERRGDGEPGSLAQGEDDGVATGADLHPGTLLAAYRHGLFPMPSGGPGSPPSWWMPARRGVLPLDGLVVSRSLRRSVRETEVRVDTAFDAVLAACADPSRPGHWIDESMVAAYTRLHEMGWAHSVEAWRDGKLVGGLYGVAIGGLFAGESMYHHAPDASKVALVGLVDLLRADGDPRRLVDVQWHTPHLGSLGVVELPRTVYQRRLAEALDAPLPPAFAGPPDR
ncbi:leucyl/phenylalanyl-tRNA--protein transferase [Nocardioides lentus]|uniref:Leucyl/phenylalanyl-tRNA--protein transferase n=1 Tax=Nocardioides lentus TaxID=338077 RepID=A0ABN2NXC3_9ACTN